jgi:uronate dehydrogenase
MGAVPSVAVTGACGRIGRALIEHLTARQYRLTAVDRPGSGVDAISSLTSTVQVDLSERPPGGLFDGAEVVVHLAGEASQEARWETLLPNNIQASYHVAQAAIDAGCRRVIFASSVHAVSASAHRPVAPGDAVAPGDLYGVTKCFVEALAFWCAQQGSMSAAAVRIGAFQTLQASRKRGSEWIASTLIAAPDLVSLLERAINAEYQFALLHATAPGRDVLLDTRATEELLGWQAEHRF